MKTVAEFKRRLKVGVKMHTIWHLDAVGRAEDGSPIYRDNDKGIREVSIVQSNSFALKTPKIVEGKEVFVDSWCEYPKASLTTFEDGAVTIWGDNREKIVKVLTYKFV